MILTLASLYSLTDQEFTLSNRDRARRNETSIIKILIIIIINIEVNLFELNKSRIETLKLFGEHFWKFRFMLYF